MKSHVTSLLALVLAACGSEPAPRVLPDVAVSQGVVKEVSVPVERSAEIAMTPSLTSDAVPLASIDESPVAVSIPTASSTNHPSLT